MLLSDVLQVSTLKHLCVIVVRKDVEMNTHNAIIYT